MDTRTVEPGTGSPDGNASASATTGRDGGVTAREWQPVTARREV